VSSQSEIVAADRDGEKLITGSSIASLRPILVAGAIFPLVMVLLVTGLLAVQIEQRSDDVTWTEHSDQVLATANDGLRSINQMSAFVRDYVISGEMASKKAYEQAQAYASASLSAMAFLVRDNPSQLERINAISQLKGHLDTRFDEVIESHDSAGCAECRSGLAASRHVESELAGDFGQFIDAEAKLRTIRQQSQSASGRRLVEGLVLLVVVVVSASVYSIWSTVKQVAKVYNQALENAGKSRTQAETANRAKDEFLSIVSHELRGPLSAMSMWTQVLLGGPADDQKLRKGLEAISRAIQSESQMINDLLDVSRIEAGKLRLDVRTVDLPAVIEAAVETVRPSADARDIQIHVLLDTNAGPVAGDPERLQQVFWNLLSNAVKFTQKEGRIEVKLERINSHVEIAVSDNGRGIEPAALARIFQPFWQEDSGSARTQMGLGLGLSIVRQIVEMHGGSVSATSDGPGHGSSFAVVLPVSLANRTAGDLREHPTIAIGPRTRGGIRLDGIRIMAVDDQPDAVAAIRGLLESCGADVRGVESAGAALEELSKWRPDVIVSDIGMPVEDGYHFIRRLRERKADQGGEIPAIALTAYGRVQDTVRLLEAGFQMHVTKPVEPDELFAAIRSVVRNAPEMSK
jgi:signal transduction histidine kinase/ActR/RegA family two-component response regulator